MENLSGRLSSKTALENAIANLHAAITETGAQIEYVASEMPVVTGDEHQLTRLFQNLISNSIKFRGSEKPKISICSDKAGNEWLFFVSDNGIGISPRHQERIFQIFQRLHPADKYPGSGIGLTIAKRIVERHGGRIWVESEEGKGATFYFTIPA